MSGLRYVEEVVTLELHAERCNGCRECVAVCPHAVFEMADKRARIVDRDACMECGACARNCACDAITLSPGVGCAAAIIHGWVTRSQPGCG
jgi:ferredoxin